MKNKKAEKKEYSRLVQKDFLDLVNKPHLINSLTRIREIAVVCSRNYGTYTEMLDDLSLIKKLIDHFKKKYGKYN